MSYFKRPPKALYAKVEEPDGPEEWIQASENPAALAEHEADTKVGVYSLVEIVTLSNKTVVRTGNPKKK